MGTRTYSRRGANGQRVPTALGIRTGKFTGSGAPAFNPYQQMPDMPDINKLTQRLRQANNGGLIPNLLGFVGDANSATAVRDAQREQRDNFVAMRAGQRPDPSNALQYVLTVADDIRQAAISDDIQTSSRIVNRVANEFNNGQMDFTNRFGNTPLTYTFRPNVGKPASLILNEIYRDTQSLYQATQRRIRLENSIPNLRASGQVTSAQDAENLRDLTRWQERALERRIESDVAGLQLLITTPAS